MTVDPPTTRTVLLHAYGRMNWPELRRRWSMGEAAWADYHGFHLGPLPKDIPPYSHLWAWTPQWLLRARLDGDTAIVGMLQTGDTLPEGIAPARDPEQLSCRCLTADTWPGKEQRVGPLTESLTDRKVRLWQVAGGRPVTFVEVC